MDVLLISSRSSGSEPHPSGVRALEMASSLASAGHAVRWICPEGSGKAGELAVPGNVEQIRVSSQAPPFHEVQGQLADLELERILCGEIRRRLPDIVHQVGFGGEASVMLPWIADRLGSHSIVTLVSREEFLCHKGVLVNERGDACQEWENPQRCVECCHTPSPGGLTARQAFLARWMRWFPALSRYPQVPDFEIRRDLLVGGLLPATLVLVASEDDAAMVSAMGVPRSSIELSPRSGDVEALLATHDLALGRAVKVARA